MGDGIDSRELEDFAHPTLSYPVALRDGPRVEPGAAGWMQRIGIEQGSDLTQGSDDLAVSAAIDERPPGGRGVEPKDYAHGCGLAGPVWPEETGDPPRLHCEAQLVERRDGPETLGELDDLDHGWSALLMTR